MITLALSLLLSQEWEYHQEFGFVDRSTMDKKTPAEFLQHALKERDRARYAESIQVLDLILRHVPDAALRESAQFERAGTFFKAGAFYEAYHEYETFILRFPQSERVTTAKRLEMTSALELARVGKKGFLGISAGSKTGVEYLRDALRRYPREDFSSDFNQKLGMFFYERSEYDQAAEEFARVLELYGDTPDAVLALYMLGRTSEVRFESVDYDMKPLRDARRQYERFLEESDRMRKLPDPARRWVEGLVPAVRERLSKVYGFMLQKQLKTAEYYDWKDAPRSARLYYQAILKEEEAFRKILRDFPESAAARKARARLAEKK